MLENKNISQHTPKNTANKGLYGMLLLTVVVTGWMAFDDATSQDVSLGLVQPAKANMRNYPIGQTVGTSTPLLEHTTAAKAFSLKEKKARLPLEQEGELFPWEALNRVASKAPMQDVFKAHSWLVAPPPVPPAAELPPPAPQAPPAPFQYVGKMENTPNTGKIFLIQHNQFYYVANGELINKEWRLDKEEANLIRLTYLPLNLPQVLLKSAKPVSAAPAAAPDAAIEPQ